MRAIRLTKTPSGSATERSGWRSSDVSRPNTRGFRITYEHVVATDSAVTTLAQPSEPVNRIRGMIRQRLRLPPETRNEADLVHTTLFRYRGALCDPEKLLAMLEDTSADATAEVEELVVSKELVYPSLEAEVLGRLPLASR
jgi:hypothetical protein